MTGERLCEACGISPARWYVFAAYNSTDPYSDGVHPAVRRYPMPQARVCDEHLPTVLARDLSGFASTRQWVIQAAAATVEDAHRLTSTPNPSE